MLFRSILPAIAGLALAPQIAFAAPTGVPEHLEDGTVKFTVEGRDLQKRSVYLQDFSGCSTDQKNDLISSWQNMLQMANKITGKVNFNEVVAIDFFGDPTKNTAAQSNIEALINNVATWTFGSVFAWHMSLRCDDWQRTKTINNPDKGNGNQAYGCPPGTAEADYYKCSSRCFQAKLNSDGSLYEWKTRALAYTTNGGSVNPVAWMNYCPGWWDQLPCQDAYAKYSKYGNSGTAKWDLTNYQCREQAMVHELMHVDSHSRFATHNSDYHVYDRTIKLANSNNPIQAYGPLYTKVLANWGQGRNPGKFVATNADSLALYFLAKWILENGGFYPDRPRTGDVPKSIGTRRRRQDSTDDFDPIALVNGQVEQGDLNDLAAALGLGNDTADAPTDLEFADAELDCDDLLTADNGTTVTCYDQTSDASAYVANDANSAIDLDGTIGYPTQVTVEPLCGGTEEMLNSTIESYYQAVGSFGDGEWKIYNMDCGVANNLVLNPPDGNACDQFFGCDQSSGTLEFTTMVAGGQNYNCVPAEGTQTCGTDTIGYCCQYVDISTMDPTLPGLGFSQ